MKCLVCRGACCESIRIPLPRVSADDRRWLALHAKPVEDGLFEFEARCSKLTPAGACGIYEDRPLTCRLFEPGGRDCLITVQERRSPEQYQQIRDDSDPPTIHDKELYVREK